MRGMRGMDVLTGWGGGLCSGGDTARVRKFYSTIYKIHTLTVMCGSDFNYKVIASHFLS